MACLRVQIAKAMHLIIIFCKRERNPIECVHYFPTEEEAAIVGFEAEVDGRLIQSKVNKE